MLINFLQVCLKMLSYKNIICKVVFLLRSSLTSILKLYLNVSNIIKTLCLRKSFELLDLFRSKIFVFKGFEKHPKKQ